MKIDALAFWLWRSFRIPDQLRWALLSQVNQKFLVGTAAVVLNDDKQVLLFHHTYRDQYPWGLPSGWVQYGEDPGQAIEREVLEESGLIVKTTEVISVSTAKRVPRLDIFLLACPVGGTFVPSVEVSDARYFTVDALPPMLLDQRAMILQGLNPR